MGRMLCFLKWRDFENRGVNYQSKRIAASASFGNVLEMQFLVVCRLANSPSWWEPKFCDAFLASVLMHEASFWPLMRSVALGLYTQLCLFLMLALSEIVKSPSKTLLKHNTSYSLLKKEAGVYLRYFVISVLLFICIC